MLFFCIKLLLGLCVYSTRPSDRKKKKVENKHIALNYVKLDKKPFQDSFSAF